ncbi:beta-lactamase-like protein [Sporodiniella umbellata]|nr:beta-lactamase-like protein [Sporodiniella umbellata]
MSTSLSQLAKSHQEKKAELKKNNEQIRKNAIQATQQLTVAVNDYMNEEINEIFSKQKDLEHQSRKLASQTQKYATQTQQWLSLVDNFNNSLKELGDVKNWAQIMENDMKTIMSTLEFVHQGTGSAQPSSTRNHQAIALRLDGDTWLFDCGEATQHQLQKSKLKMGKISHLFITHMHGDHCFGLGPLLCSMSDHSSPTDSAPIEIYGPTPLRSWIRNTLRSTYTNLGRPYRVHELLHQGDKIDSNDDLHPNELPGENITSEDGVFKALPFCKPYFVSASAIEHSIPSLGYVVREPESVGKLDGLIPLVKEQAEALKERGIKNPMRVLGEIQRTNAPYELPNGLILHPPAIRPGREIVILGDTCNPSKIASLTHQPTLLVHEATNALTSLDPSELTLGEVEERTKSHGHSTPQMAAAFARLINCRKLILTHFSARYSGDEAEESKKIMEEIRQYAIQEFDNREEDVYCARDLWSFDIKMEY